MGAFSRTWHRAPELAVVLGLMLLTLPLFWLTDLDLTAAAWFHEPGHPDNPWPHQAHWLWRGLYKGAWLMAGALALGGVVAVLVARLRPSWRLWQPRGWFLLLVILLGSGLVVNVIFKDQWGRYRPRDVVELGGDHAFQPLLVPGERGRGKSFPCGHCSAGFAFVAFWLLWRRSRPRLARSFLVGAIALGLLMGVGRMSAGAHFLSDVLWSGFMTFLVAWLVYYRLLKVPQSEARIAAGHSERPSWRQRLLLALAAVAVLVGALLAKPMNVRSDHRFQADQLPGAGPLPIAVDAADLRLTVRRGEPALALRLQVHGFGLPWNRVEEDLAPPNPGEPWHYSVEHHGVYSELRTTLEVTADPAIARRLAIDLGQGDVRLQGDPATTPPLDITTRDGQIIWQP
jgi:membrane-associated PAP2 superfamily phosphatase